MDAKDIIEKLAKDKEIENIISEITEVNDDSDKDLAQDLYISLMTKEPSLIEKMYNEGKLHYFIVKMVLYNIKSFNSPYYYTYKKYRIKTNYNLDGTEKKYKDNKDRTEGHNG